MTVLRRSTRTLAASVFAVAFVVLGLAGTAGAQCSGYNCPPSLAANTPSTNSDGSFTVTLTAEGFGPGTTVTFSYNPTLGTAVANASGVATLVATFPASLAGKTVTVTATGVNAAGAPISVTTNVSFGGGGGGTGGTGSGGSSSGLAFTGSDTSSVALRIGAVALVLGVALVLAARGRRSEHVDA